MMRLYKTIILTGGLFITAAFGLAQNVDFNLQIVIAPKQSIVRLNGEKIPAGVQRKTVEPGIYRVQAWYPKHEYVEAELIVKKDSLTKFSKLLHFSPEYIEYRNALRKQNSYPGIGAVALGGAMGLGYFAAQSTRPYLNRRKAILGNAWGARKDYYSSYDEDDQFEAQSRLQSLEKSFRRNRRNYYLKSGASLAGMGALIYVGIIYLKKWKNRPNLTYDEPARLSFHYLPEPQGTGRLGMALNF